MNSSALPRDRRAAQKRGAAAETVAALFLRLKGFRILARGAKAGRGSGAGEVDLVARRGDLVIFVEVKSRPTAAQALDSLRLSQRKRIERGAAFFLARHPRLGRCAVRFDMVLVTPWHWPRHIQDAWRID